jgi:hypothetical protein
MRLAAAIMPITFWGRSRVTQIDRLTGIEIEETTGLEYDN